MSKKLPDTSIDAYKALTPEKLSDDYKHIILALKTLGSGTYENIANFLGWTDINKCSRRLKELETMEIIWKPGAKRLTKRNRPAYVYCLTGQFPKTENEAGKKEYFNPNPDEKKSRTKKEQNLGYNGNNLFNL